MPTTFIPAHTDGATVEIFEPRQHQDQEEVVLDRFELLPGESRDYEINSATAGMRYLPLGDETRRQLLERDPPPPAEHKNPYGILPREEMDAGASRVKEVEAMEKSRDKAAAKGGSATNRENREPVDRRAKDETKTGAEAQKQFAQGVQERGEAPRGSNEPHAGTPDEEGQPVNSRAAHISEPAGGISREGERTAANSPRVVSEPDQAQEQQNARRQAAEEPKATKGRKGKSK